MNRRRLYYVLLSFNLAFLLIVVFSKCKVVCSTVGIILLIQTYLVGLKIEPESSWIKTYNFGDYCITLGGIEALVLGIMGLYSMMNLTEDIPAV